jgi:hypothetical protein
MLLPSHLKYVPAAIATPAAAPPLIKVRLEISVDIFNPPNNKYS